MRILCEPVVPGVAIESERHRIQTEGPAPFGRLDSGNRAPARPFASFTNPFGLVVDAHSDEIFVSPGVDLVQVYNRMGSALRTIGGSATLLTKSASPALLRDGTLLAGNQYGSSTTNDAIFGYGRSQNGAERGVRCDLAAYRPETASDPTEPRDHTDTDRCDRARHVRPTSRS